MFSINEHSCNTLGMYILGHSRMGQPFLIGQCKMGQVIKESYVISSFFSSTWRFLTTDLSFKAGCSSRFNSQVIVVFVTRLVITEITELCTKVSDFFALFYTPHSVIKCKIKLELKIFWYFIYKFKIYSGRDESYN